MNFTEEDLRNIQVAHDAGGDIWNNAALANIKRKIKQFYRSNGPEVCCYCRRDFTDEFNMVIDIEHILPKSKYSEFMFEIGNLNISCMRCNMNIKKNKDDFVVDTTQVRNDYTIPTHYYFIHPNFDIYQDNLEYFRVVVNDTKITKYLPKTEKGGYTYKYFRLSNLEVDSFNKAQGVISKDNEETVSGQATEEIKRHLELLISKL